MSLYVRYDHRLGYSLLLGIHVLLEVSMESTTSETQLTPVSNNNKINTLV